MGSWARWPSWQGWGDAWAQPQGLPLRKAWLATGTAECVVCQQQRPTLNPQYDTIPWGDQPATWRQTDYIRPLPPWKGQCFVLTGVDTPDINLPPLNSVLLLNCHLWSYRISYPSSCHSTQHCFQSWNSLSQPRKHSNGPMLVESTGLMFPSILKQLAW